MCEEARAVQETSRRACGQFMAAVLDGWLIDRAASGLDGLTDTELQQLVNKLMADPLNDQQCVFTR